MINAPGYETLFSANGILVICYSVTDQHSSLFVPRMSDDDEKSFMTNELAFPSQPKHLLGLHFPVPFRYNHRNDSAEII